MLNVVVLCIDLEGLDINPAANGRKHELQKLEALRDIRVLGGRREKV
jgi:hypothetical protein